MVKKFSITLNVLLAMFVATFSSGLLPAATAYAATPDMVNLDQTELVEGDKAETITPSNTDSVADNAKEEKQASQPEILPPATTQGQIMSLTTTCGELSLMNNCDSPSPTPCEVPTDGGVITQRTSGWGLSDADAEFIDGGVALSSNDWSGSYIYSNESYPISQAMQLDWTTTGTVSGAGGSAIILETTTGAFIHYEPVPYTDDFWTNTPGILPMNGGGQGGPYSGSLQDLLNTGGDLTVALTYFYFNSATPNEIVLNSLSFNCATYTFDKEADGCPSECTNPCLEGQIYSNGECVPICTSDCNPQPVDKCPLVDGIQTDTTLCPPIPGGGGVDDACPLVPGNQTDTTQCPSGEVLGGTSTTPTTPQGGQGGGHILGEAATTALPETLPATGGLSFLTQWLPVIAAAFAYGVASFMQSRKQRA